ncbi:hypothetical protein PVK06_043655 [Gossypium arboreum]|uniref:DUF7745 domain-containing protein n=1 Tax=Gossypium arboreum TaxID=29729 RepID=A0ABR0MP10_GOSAR|nr:hypothetical protein PVK06_043655 [Gossypium arboreum]
MTVVVTPLSGSETLRLREVFAFVQDSGSLSGYIRTYGFSEQTQLEKGHSIAVGYVSELSDYTRISVMQNKLQELKEIWDQWGKKTKQLFYDNYGDLPYLLDVQVDEHLFRALAQFWNPAYSCFTFGEVDLVPTMEEYTALLRCPRFQNDRIYSRAACVPTFWKKLMIITGMSEQWITTRIIEKGECNCILWDALKDLILTHPDETKKVDVFALSLYGLMVFPRALGYMDEATTDLFHRLSKRVTFVPTILAETFRSLGTCRRAGASSFDWVPLLGICGAIGYAPLLVLRQHGLRQFVLVTQGLAQSEFVYRGADYKRKVSEVSSAWKKAYRLKRVAINPVTTPEYVEWRELEIMKQEFERKNLEFEKRVAKLKEEKMYLSLDVDVQKMKVEKERKEKKKIEKDRDDLEEHYKKAQVSLRRVRVEDLEVALHDGELRIEQLEAQEDCLKEELHQVKGQVRDRDYIIGEAIAQI